jgi:hypothetical protein
LSRAFKRVLANANAPLAVGDSVRFGLEKDRSDRLRAVNIRTTKRAAGKSAASSEFVTATVTNLVPEKRFGFVRLPDERSAFFHFNYFPDDTFVPEVGTGVRCRVADAPRGLQAYDVWKFSAAVDTAPSVRSPSERKPSRALRWKLRKRNEAAAMNANREYIEKNATKLAQEFRRQFGRWLRDIGIDHKAVSSCRRRKKSSMCWPGAPTGCTRSGRCGGGSSDGCGSD